MSPTTVWFMLLYFIGINILAASRMKYDKEQSKKRNVGGHKHGIQRVPENEFFIFSIFGGWIGIVWGMKEYRHKTIKTSFQKKIAAGAVMNIGVIAMIIGLSQ
ncbi:hypothetical protein COX05_02125 [candidate division WWE3 bacterium CG22_combo_CG10-13_8_21_14_all_39_12]|uniref:DUF1294 domain-containing protein n=2 Tax=Katanobacteria TaxID=422282 RepID=A0A2M7WZY9_UNCKA|nr:MAG: hypothetical protein COX05_02125 [candidate division WWE3 bacterium CG22_combo_CG10-13_8_21_14_all_39_12]PJA39278.1 MAG: hypothetical protein CO179_05575 [candidate division WWE3 bacterium CG_4_9_14_3_um_filter_39_7]